MGESRDCSVALQLVVLPDEQSHPQEIGMEVHRTTSVCALGDSPQQMQQRIKAQKHRGPLHAPAVGGSSNAHALRKAQRL